MDIEKALERLREIEMPEEMKKRILSKMSVDQEKEYIDEKGESDQGELLCILIRVLVGEGENSV